MNHQPKQNDTSNSDGEAMNKTNIDWCDYTANPVKGYCPMACEYCYARRLYDRFGWDKTIRLDMTAFDVMPREPSRIFVGSTMELFGEWVPDDWIAKILREVQTNPRHTFIFLTKRPERLARWNPWPGNTWVGVTVTDGKYFGLAAQDLHQVKAPVKFISFEPLHGPVQGWGSGIDWIIVGAETGNRKGKPRLDQVQKWANEIVMFAKVFNIPVFIKDNLGWPEVCREWPSLEEARRRYADSDKEQAVCP